MSLLVQAAKKAARRAGTAGTSARSTHLLRWLVSLGGIGVFGVAIIDSSVIPLPLPGSTDLLLLLLASHRGGTAKTAILLAACAWAGSMIGGYLTWHVGLKGGEAALKRYVPKGILARVTGWVEKYGAWSVALAAALPPPVPLTPFVLAAGALKVTRGRFLTFYGVARAVRYGLLAWLGVTYGRRIVRTWQKEMTNWSTTILWVYGGLVVLGILFGVWKFRRTRRSGRTVVEAAEEPA